MILKPLQFFTNKVETQCLFIFQFFLFVLPVGLSRNLSCFSTIWMDDFFFLSHILSLWCFRHGDVLAGWPRTPRAGTFPPRAAVAYQATRAEHSWGGRSLLADRKGEDEHAPLKRPWKLGRGFVGRRCTWWASGADALWPLFLTRRSRSAVQGSSPPSPSVSGSGRVAFTVNKGTGKGSLDGVFTERLPAVRRGEAAETG